MGHFKVIEESDDLLVLEGPIALFGGQDLTKEHFHKGTNFDSAYTRTGRLYVDWEHGLMPDRDADGKAIVQPGPDDVLGYVDYLTAHDTDLGKFARYALDRRSKYVDKFIRPMVEVGMVGVSSEAIEGKTVKTTDGRIDVWPLKRQALTFQPCEPRTMTEQQLAVLKSLGVELPEPDGQQAVAEGAGDAPDAATASEGAGELPQAEIIRLRARAYVLCAEGA